MFKGFLNALRLRCSRDFSKIFLTFRIEWCLLGAQENESHIRIDEAKPATGWRTHVHLAPVRLAAGHSGGISHKRLKIFFRKTRDCQSTAGFLFGKTTGPTPGTKRKAKMNTNYKRVPARFGPEIRFEVKSAPPAAVRAAQDTELERLKTRLLTQTLNELAAPEAGVIICRAAIEAWPVRGENPDGAATD